MFCSGEVEVDNFDVEQEGGLVVGQQCSEYSNLKGSLSSFVGGVFFDFLKCVYD